MMIDERDTKEELLESSPKRRDNRRGTGDNNFIYPRNYHDPIDFKIILRDIVGTHSL